MSKIDDEDKTLLNNGNIKILNYEKGNGKPYLESAQEKYNNMNIDEKKSTNSLMKRIYEKFGLKKRRQKNNKINENERYNKIAGSLIGGAIGDALGYQIEFKGGVTEKEVTRFAGKGIISDDTQMTLFTANALLWWKTRARIKGVSSIPVDAIYLGYLDWLETQTKEKSEITISWIKEIPELNNRRAPGITCISSLSSKKKGTIDNPINNSKGCGTVMRIAPIGLYLNSSLYAGEVATEVSALTHGHPLGYIPSFVMASMINLILNNNMNLIDSLNESIKLLKRYNKFKNEDVQVIISLIDKAVELSKKNISDTEAIKELGEGWVAEEALAIALYSCLKYSNSFEDAIVCAVNHDGDSDSTGAIAGNIIGTYLGLKKIPKYYLDNLELKDVILEIAHDLSIDVPVGEYENNNDKQWLDKYLYHHKK